MADILSTLAAIIIPLLIIARQVYLAMKQQREQRPAAGPQRGPNPAPRQPAQPALEDEIEQFLRRAADRRASGSPSEVEVLELDDAPRTARRPPRQQGRAQPKPKSPTQPVIIEIVHEEPAVPRESLTQQHLQSTLTSRTLQPRGTQQAEQQFEDHLHETFDHQVGTIWKPLGEGRSEQTESVRRDEDALASSIRQRLRNPDSCARPWSCKKFCVVRFKRRRAKWH